MSDWLASPNRKDKKRIPFYLLPIAMVLLFISGINLGKLVQGLKPIKPSNSHELIRPRYLGEVLFDPHQPYPKEPIENTKSIAQAEAMTEHQQAKELRVPSPAQEGNDLDFPKILPQQGTNEEIVDISIPKIKANDSLPPIPRLNDQKKAIKDQGFEALIHKEIPEKSANMPKDPPKDPPISLPTYSATPKQTPVIAEPSQRSRIDDNAQDMLGEIDIEAAEPEADIVLEKPMLSQHSITPAESTPAFTQAQEKEKAQNIKAFQSKPSPNHREPSSAQSINLKLPNGKFWVLQVQAISKGINEAEAARAKLVMYFNAVYLQEIEVNGKRYYRVHIAIDKDKQKLKAAESQYLSLFPQAEKPRMVQTQKHEGQWH